MNILIIPTVREVYSNQIEFSVDRKLVNFLRYTFGPNIHIDVFLNKLMKKYNLIILSGGNDLPSIKKSKNNIIRFNIDTKIYNYSLKKKIPLIGICYGAQFISFKNNLKIIKKKHIGNHKVFFTKNFNLINKKYIITNSFHNYIITQVKKNIVTLARTNDGSIELFKFDKKKILGIMWHPERNKRFKMIDKKIIKKFYDTCNTFRG